NPDPRPPCEQGSAAAGRRAGHEGGPPPAPRAPPRRNVPQCTARARRLRKDGLRRTGRAGRPPAVRGCGRTREPSATEGDSRRMATNGFQGAIFDVDGVLVDSPHERAWRQALRELMEGEWADIRDRTTWSPEAFTSEVYQRVISGRPRMSGALGALEHFGVPDAVTRAKAYADRKQHLIVEFIEAGEFTAFPDAIRFGLAVRAAGIPMAAASSSKNAPRFLKRIRVDVFAEEEKLDHEFVRPGMTLYDLFAADMSGRDLVRGKPDP